MCARVAASASSVDARVYRVRMVLTASRGEGACASVRLAGRGDESGDNLAARNAYGSGKRVHNCRR